MRATALKIVPPPIQKPLAVYDDAKGLKAVAGFRAKLLAASVRYILEARDGTIFDRQRTASNLSGIPLSLLAIEVAKAQKQ